MELEGDSSTMERNTGFSLVSSSQQAPLNLLSTRSGAPAASSGL